MKSSVRYLIKPDDIKAEESAPKTELRKIWKQPLITDTEQVVLLPKDSEILNIDRDPNNRLSMWYSFKTSGRPNELPEVIPYIITIIATGDSYNPIKVGEYMGSVSQGPYIWHLFIKPK